MYWLLLIIVLGVVVAIIYFSIKKDGSGGYEEGKKQFEEDNFLGQYYGERVGKLSKKLQKKWAAILGKVTKRNLCS